jgi:ribosome-binding protein aMBF1 (putative translation factor)
MSKNNQLTQEELQRIRQLDFTQIDGYVDASELLAKQVGEKGTTSREEFDAKARAWYYGEILRDRRKSLGMTQKELAEKVGRERTYINRVEKGETDMQLSSFLRIADALGMSLRFDFA